MSAQENDEAGTGWTAPCHLMAAQQDLLIAQLHLAAVEDEVAGTAFEDLLFVRRLIGMAFDQVKVLHEKMMH